jgi:hypothetical protein
MDGKLGNICIGRFHCPCYLRDSTHMFTAGFAPSVRCALHTSALQTASVVGQYMNLSDYGSLRLRWPKLN